MIDPLIIFDCDGVLVDSELISLGLLIENFAAYDIEISLSLACDLFLGKPVKTASDEVHKHFGQKVPDVDLVDFQAKVLASFESGLKPVQGIEIALAELSNDKCVASSSNLERIKGSLRITNLDSHFGDSIFSTDFVKRGKPHPDIFLYACNVMNGNPSSTIVIEDSPAGIIAAKSAGMKTIGFTGGNHASPANLYQRIVDLSPDIVIPHMSTLPEAIQILSKR